MVTTVKIKIDRNLDSGLSGPHVDHWCVSLHIMLSCYISSTLLQSIHSMNINLCFSGSILNILAFTSKLYKYEKPSKQKDIKKVIAKIEDIWSLVEVLSINPWCEFNLIRLKLVKSNVTAAELGSPHRSVRDNTHAARCYPLAKRSVKFKNLEDIQSKFNCGTNKK